ncbi:MAG: MmgE/PrpD family protein [Proteobacteria bacterium]|nr:MmgE/PrpD family protein [Pseudomonadota bacterium]
MPHEAPMTVERPTWMLAEFAAGLDYDRLPGDVRGQLGDFFLDYLRVASMGARAPWSKWARDFVAQRGGTGKSYVLFSAERIDPVSAAFLNCTYAGSIDSDDTHVGAMLHAGCIAFSAALAVGQQIGASGRDVMSAVAAGYEAMIRIALSVQPSHFARGFQSTATCGGFAAATAAAHLLFTGEDRPRRIAETLGLVASRSAGLAQFYRSGSTVKRIHAAWAAEAGVGAALLASSGFSGPTDILEGSEGFARAYADEVDFTPLADGLGSTYRLCEVMVKAHSCSARVQAAAEGALSLCQELGIGPADIARVRVGIPAVIEGRLTHAHPVDVQAAQMSLPFTVALACSRAAEAGPGFSLTIEDYESGLADPAITELSGRVSCQVEEELNALTTAEAVPARLTLTLASGEEHSIYVKAPMGSAARPFTHADHVARFERELRRRIPAENCARLIAWAEDFASLDDVNEIGRVLGGYVFPAGSRGGGLSPP